MIQLNKKEIVAFRKTIPAGEREKIEERIKGDGTVENLNIKFYIGQELYLKVMPYIRHIGNKIQYMVTVAGEDNNWLTGDDDDFNFNICIPVSNDDILVVEYDNTSSYDYNLVVNIAIDYYGGKNRVIDGVVR